jgi:uncharacterized protein (DUF2132 family)
LIIKTPCNFNLARRFVLRFFKMINIVNNDPLHGVTLKIILERLVNKYGWKELGEMIKINCFTDNPSINSSLKFLRKQEWARKKVEALYIEAIEEL